MFGCFLQHRNVSYPVKIQNIFVPNLNIVLCCRYVHGSGSDPVRHTRFPSGSGRSCSSQRGDVWGDSAQRRLRGHAAAAAAAGGPGVLGPRTEPLQRAARTVEHEPGNTRKLFIPRKLKPL